MELSTPRFPAVASILIPQMTPGGVQSAILPLGPAPMAFHRVEAAVAAKIDKVECDVRQGTREDAQWFSFGANQAHGLRRTNEDKQRAVKAALIHPAGISKSNRDIARHIGVDEGPFARGAIS